MDSWLQTEVESTSLAAYQQLAGYDTRRAVGDDSSVCHRILRDAPAPAGPGGVFGVFSTVGYVSGTRLRMVRMQLHALMKIADAHWSVVSLVSYHEA